MQILMNKLLVKCTVFVCQNIIMKEKEELLYTKDKGEDWRKRFMDLLRRTEKRKTASAEREYKLRRA